jgi:hypothetical protein
MQLAATGTAISLSIDGTVLIAAVDATWGATGQGGLDFSGLIQSWLSLDDFSVADVGGGGSVHAGLFGSGVINVTSPLAVNVLVTSSLPPDLGQSRISPPSYYKLASIAFADSNGTVRNWSVENPDELVIAPFPHATLLYYWFAPGVIATITELATP